MIGEYLRLLITPIKAYLARFSERFYINFIKDDRYLYLVRGLRITVTVALFALLLGMVIGLVAAFAKLSESKGDSGKGKRMFNPFAFLADVYITVIRGTPLVIQLLIIYFVIFGSVNISKVIIAIIAFGINSGAYVAEIIRAGILAVDRGQNEAGRSLGLTKSQTMKLIILPQAVKNVLPALGNEMIVLLKETSIVGYIALEDLTKGGDIIRSRTYDAFMPLIAVAIIYLTVVLGMTAALKKLERRLRRGDHR